MLHRATKRARVAKSARKATAFETSVATPLETRDADAEGAEAETEDGKFEAEAERVLLADEDGRAELDPVEVAEPDAAVDEDPSVETLDEPPPRAAAAAA